MTHTLTYVFQPTKPYFSWSLNDANKEDLEWFVQKVVCNHCILPFDDGMESGVEHIEQELVEEEGHIKRMRLTLTLHMRADASLDAAVADIENRLRVVETEFDNECVFTCPCTPPLWNPPRIFVDCQ